MPLTRFLYMADEVIVTFLETLLRQGDLGACYFWISEYYYSGFRENTWRLLWKIFYDFYAIKYPKLEKYIMTEYSKWRNEKKISYILDITLQLYGRDACPDVFIARHVVPEKKIYSASTHTWLSQFPPAHRAMASAVATKCISGIQSYMETLNYTEIYKLVCVYFNTIKKMDLQEGQLEKVPYSNKKHILLALILHLHLPESLIIVDEVDVSVSPEDISWIEEINEQPVTPLYRTLRAKRLYSISDSIGCFKLQRFDNRCPPVKRLLGFHWEYFASYAPLWRKRFRTYKATRNISTFSMDFANDDYLEEFGEKYNYEPDEQSNETQNKSIREIKKRSPSEWIEEVFGITYDRKDLIPPYI